MTPFPTRSAVRDGGVVAPNFPDEAAVARRFRVGGPDRAGGAALEAAKQPIVSLLLPGPIEGPSPNVALLLASQAAGRRQTPGTPRRSKADNVGQAPRGQRRSPGDNRCLTHIVPRRPGLAAR